MIFQDFWGTTVFVTHNREEAYELCKNIIILSEGRVNTIGNREDILIVQVLLSLQRLQDVKIYQELKN